MEGKTALLTHLWAPDPACMPRHIPKNDGHSFIAPRDGEALPIRGRDHVSSMGRLVGRVPWALESSLASVRDRCLGDDRNCGHNAAAHPPGLRGLHVMALMASSIGRACFCFCTLIRRDDSQPARGAVVDARSRFVDEFSAWNCHVSPLVVLAKSTASASTTAEVQRNGKPGSSGAAIPRKSLQRQRCPEPRFVSHGLAKCMSVLQ